MKKKLALTKLNTSAKRQDLKTLSPGCGCSCGTKEFPFNKSAKIGAYYSY